MENNTIREKGEYVPFPNAVFACIVLLVLFLMLSKMNEN
jgi:hypothetical protein